jgi:hypothetical protein
VWSGAWQAGPPPPEVVQHAARALRVGWRAKEGPWWGHQATALLSALRRAGASAVVRDLSQEMLDAGWARGAVVAALITATDARSLAAGSARVASLWPSFSLTWSGEPEELRALITAQPEVWARRAMDVLYGNHHWVATDVLAVLRQLVTLELPPVAAHDVDEAIRWLSAAPYCWFEEPWGRGAVQEADQADRLRRLRQR